MSIDTADTTDGASLTQRRTLVTEIPGPRSAEKLARKKTFVADGVGTTLPVFVEAASGEPVPGREPGRPVAVRRTGERGGGPPLR